jgi:hypothetical protein
MRDEGDETGTVTEIEADDETKKKVLSTSAQCGICLESLDAATDKKLIVLASCHLSETMERYSNQHYPALLGRSRKFFQ